MSLSPAVESYLLQTHIPFDVVEHPCSATAIQSAHSAHVTPAQVAKAVVLKSRNQYLVCVLPASHMLVLKWLERDYGERYKLAGEEELNALFPDCVLGAIPALGQAYGLKVVWDNALRHCDEVYFEGGDHRHLVHMGQGDFMALMARADHATISCTPEAVEYYQQLH